MKKKAFILAALLVMNLCIFCGCAPKETAILSVSTSDGFTGTFKAYNSSIPLWSTASEDAANSPVQIKLSEEGTAHIDFYCPTCEYSVEFDEVSPYSDTLECECSKNKNYIAIQLFAKYMDE